jgi:hypothetical protein
VIVADEEQPPVPRQLAVMLPPWMAIERTVELPTFERPGPIPPRHGHRRNRHVFYGFPINRQMPLKRLSRAYSRPARGHTRIFNRNVTIPRIPILGRPRAIPRLSEHALRLQPPVS